MTRTRAGAVARVAGARRHRPLLRPETTEHAQRGAEQPEATPNAHAVRPLMLSVQQVCGLLSIGRTTLWAMVRDGEIGAVRRGARLLFPLPIVEEYVAAQATRAREQAERRQRLRGHRGGDA